MYIDLHLHSYYSDGIYSPEELIKRAKKEGFFIISLTDHFTLDGINEAIKIGKKYKIKVIPGVEINDVIYKNYRLHLIGYGIDFKNKELNQVLKKMQKEREESVKKCILELQKEGFNLDEKKIFKTVSKSIGIGWLINFMQKGGNFKKIKKDFKLKKRQILSLNDFFKKYFVKEGKQILPSPEISLDKALSIIKKAKGIAVLAHPAQQLSWRDDWLISLLKKKGIKGIEAISSHHNWANIEHYQKIAKELKLLTTIGSDYHGDLPEKWSFLLKSIWQYFKVKINKDIQKIINELKV